MNKRKISQQVIKRDQGILPCVQSLNFNTMKASLQLVTLPEEADTLIRMAQRDRRIFSHSHESIDMQSENSEENALRTQQELAIAQADLAAATLVINTLPEGKKKEEEITRKMGLELKIRKLATTGSTSGFIPHIEKEYEAMLLEAKIVQIDAFISAVNARKAEL
jgi:hypothetical protein